MKELPTKEYFVDRIPYPPSPKRKGTDCFVIEHPALLQSPFRKTKTSEFFDENIRTFALKHPYFYPKKSDVLQLPDRRLSPLYKKSF